MIDSKDIERGGQKYRVWLVHDSDTVPGDFDCYSDTDNSAWRNGDWQYVTVYVARLCNECGDSTKEPVASLGGVEYGHLGDNGSGDDIWITLDSIIESDHSMWLDETTGNWVTTTIVDELIDEIKEGA